MKRIAFLLTAAAIMLSGCSTEKIAVQQSFTEENKAMYSAPAAPLSEDEQALYDSTVMVLLKEDLWTSRDMYDTCHYLMVPMHYAFKSDNKPAINAFAEFFERFTNDVSGEDKYGFNECSWLNRLQFLYLSTQYMNLCAANGYDDLIPEGLFELAQNNAEGYLFAQPANWGVEETVVKHINEVIAGKEYSKSYYSIIDDFEYFSLAILCDLSCLSDMQGIKKTESMETAAELAYRLFSSPDLNTETSEGGWLFQVGVWSDHPDALYAGNTEVYDGIQPKPRDDYALDSSHSFRMPMLLKSYLSAQNNVEKRELFQLRREQLANQMINYVLKKVDGKWLTTTFMDGTNGVYRYSYNTDGVGLQGYNLSGSFLIGWWTFLDDERITKCYIETISVFPLTGDISNPYFDFATVREQNEFYDMETAFDNGMFKSMVVCAAKLHLAG